MLASSTACRTSAYKAVAGTGEAARRVRRKIIAQTARRTRYKIRASIAVGQASSTDSRKKEISSLTTLSDCYCASGNSSPTSTTSTRIGKIQTTITGDTGGIAGAYRTSKRTFEASVICSEVILRHTLYAVEGVVAGGAVIITG